MTTCFTATQGVDVITTTADIPALGSIAINAFVLHGSEPVLVDTGTVAGAPEFMGALASVIDPAERRSIWLTQPTSITSAPSPRCSSAIRTCGSSHVPQRRHHGAVVGAPVHLINPASRWPSATDSVARTAGKVPYRTTISMRPSNPRKSSPLRV